MPEFICEECGKREFHENQDTLDMMVKIHNEFCRKVEGQSQSFMHREDSPVSYTHLTLPTILLV